MHLIIPKIVYRIATIRKKRAETFIKIDNLYFTLLFRSFNQSLVRETSWQLVESRKLAESWELRAESWGLRAESWELRAENWELRTEDWELGTEMWLLIAESWKLADVWLRSECWLRSERLLLITESWLRAQRGEEKRSNSRRDQTNLKKKIPLFYLLHT